MGRRKSIAVKFCGNLREGSGSFSTNPPPLPLLSPPLDVGFLRIRAKMPRQCDQEGPLPLYSPWNPTRATPAPGSPREGLGLGPSHPHIIMLV